MANLHELLKEMIDKGASDLHITTGIPPMIRIHGHVAPVGTHPLSPAETKSMAYSVLTEAQKQKFEEQWELDLS
jgi:twitching motility protein PilT